MATHAHITPMTLARRHTRAAPDALDRRRLPALRGPVDPAQRRRIAATIERLIRLLDGLDAPATDLEAEEDGCLAGDDGGLHGVSNGMGHPGDETDAEENGDLENDRADAEPSDANDPSGDRLFIVYGGVPV